MDFIVALIKKLPLVPIALFIVGIILGLLVGWVVAPVKFVDATPSYLRADLQEDYLRMAIDSYSINPNPNLAVQRWNDLGAGANEALQKIQSNPGTINQAALNSYAELVRNATIANGQSPTGTASGSSMTKTALIIFASVLVLGVAAASAFYLYRLLGKRGSGEVTTTMQAVEINRHAEKTDFEVMGLVKPIMQTMSTYLIGDDLYDELFEINPPSGGKSLGQYGVGISKDIGVGGPPKKVTAFEVWLFDHNDLKTATKVLMSRHAYNDPEIRGQLEPKGELILIEPQAKILLETDTLQLLGTVIDLEYGKGPQPTDSYFERITIEFAVWPRQQAS
ncbi:MAG: hypothetical protein HZB50_07475 [Chloroflexi bacterium]|nr:hypothetical protein [Chloroflexota bacterium]